MISLRAVGVVVAVCTTLFACQSRAEDADVEQDEGAISQLENVPELGPRIDRIGRPEITNFLVIDRTVAPKAGPNPFKEAYNAEDSFAIPAERLARYTAAMKASLVHYDAQDGTPDLDDAMAERLAAILVEDQLRIDIAKPCTLATAGYLDLERAAMLGRSSATCGGRTPNEDVFDTLMTLYTHGPSRPTPQVGDDVGSSASTGTSTDAFPYLAKPHLVGPKPAAP
jgi:Domain of unknown function (DUF4331)